MLCRDCMNIGICKHYEYLCQHPHLSIDRCGYYNPIAIKKEEPVQEGHIEKFIPKILPLNNNVKEYEKEHIYACKTESLCCKQKSAQHCKSTTLQ